MPSGCPEQTFFSFVPNIAAMWYLNSTGKLTEAHKQRTQEHIRFGYQKLMKIKDSTDGSFTFWHDKSIWLTAYAVKLLAHIKSVTEIKPKDIIDALGFLAKAGKDGVYTKEAQTSSWAAKNMKANLLDGEALSAFVAIAFLETKQKNVVADFEEYQTTVDAILNSVIEKISSIQDNHVKAMYAYAFSLNKNKTEAERWLEDLMANRKELDNKIYWENGTNAEKVETAAYAVMAYTTLGKIEDAWPIVNWMMSQLSDLGGYYTTTDTVIGIQALCLYAEKVYSPSKHMTVSLSNVGGPENPQIYKINNKTGLSVVKYDFPPSASNISISVKGTQNSNNGFALVQVVKSYNFAVNATNKFDLTVDLQAGSEESLNIKICANIIENDKKNVTEMTLIEVQLPSGYEHLAKNSKELLDSTDVQVSLCF